MEIVLATANKGKIAEIVEIMAGLPVTFVTKDQMPPWPEIVESGDTYVENALIKARALVEFSGVAAIADDSGIEIDALDGAPGVRSARFSGPDATDEQNNERMRELLKDVPAEKRTARYRCVAVLVTPEGTTIDAEGTCEGRIAMAPEGDNGFGYDPWFIPAEQPEGQELTFGRLPLEYKHGISHRGKALRELAAKMADLGLS
ncbi:MAG TPA: RdgB/HAM1 family non-canonical purine NTP pyrophosphatase [Actinomycetota bacterium]|nr:RdgB/HAM1 family non-canonical purine NTP pyrophosphatase [Actinomycetota bacterium]